MIFLLSRMIFLQVAIHNDLPAGRRPSVRVYGPPGLMGSLRNCIDPEGPVMVRYTLIPRYFMSVVTYQSSNGSRVAICRSCERRLVNAQIWLKDSSGVELAIHRFASTLTRSPTTAAVAPSFETVLPSSYRPITTGNLLLVFGQIWNTLPASFFLNITPLRGCPWWTNPCGRSLMSLAS